MCSDASFATMSRSSGASQQRQVIGEPLSKAGRSALFATSQSLTVPLDKPHAR